MAPTGTTPSLGRQAAAADQLRWARTCQALFVVPDEPPEGTPVVPDVLNEANLWEWGGISFGQLETYRLYLAVKKVKEATGLFLGLRFCFDQEDQLFVAISRKIILGTTWCSYMSPT